MDARRIKLIDTVITRRRITVNQICLFKALYEAGNNWVSKPELAVRTQKREVIADKILGGLGNRINKTAGIKPPYDGYGLLMECEIHNGELHYRILPELCTVIERLPDLQNAIKLSVDEIRKLYKKGLELR